jgi:hypothetical protein
MALQRLSDKKVKRLREKLNLDILAAHTENNHRLTLYTREKRVFHLYRGRLTECEDCSIGVVFTPELLAHWEALDGNS